MSTARELQEQNERRAARARLDANNARELTAFVGGALASGALGPQGKAMIPAEIMGIDTDLVLGGVSYFYSRRGRGKNHAYARGFAFQALAGGLRDVGASLATRF